jgi:DNA polymerase-2
VRRGFPAAGRDLWSGAELPVVGVELAAYPHLPRLQAWLGRLGDRIGVYNADLDVAASYLYSRRVWPCAWYELELTGNRLRGLRPLEEQFALELSLPPLVTLHLSLTRDPLIPLEAGNGLALSFEGRTLELEGAPPAQALREVARILRQVDPDLVVSDWGDEEILPPLLRVSRRHRVPLPLDREPAPPSRRGRGGRTYFSYGRIVYQGPSTPFYGRWHVDRKNSFFWREAGLAGLVQISRLGQLPLQQAARASPGTLITSMQLARAVADGILIPWRKGTPEDFKTAGDLLTIDKGGLTFMPPVSLHWQVAELDFASMYPTIMTTHNISPETVNCGCCAQGRSPVPPSPRPLPPTLRGPGEGQAPQVPGPFPPAPVPEAGYRLCGRREGLVPRTLRPLLELRARLKARAREVPPEWAASYRERQNALKWMLVTCFGYLGYKNARFGRIEAHEAVTAHGRDKLLTAKEMAEAAGFRVLHGLTDCLWVQKPGMTRAELEELCREITRATGVTLALEGIYRWLAFLPSRQEPTRPVATRYFGVFEDGTLKVRGLLCRRRDTPPVIRRAQEAVLAEAARAGTPAALAAVRSRLREVAEGFRQRLQEGGLLPQELVITRVLSQAPEDFRVRTAVAQAARQLQDAGITLVPGEKVRYVHREPTGGPPELRVVAAPFLEGLEDYDAGFYLELLGRALREVEEGLYGVGKREEKHPRAPRLPAAPRQLCLWGEAVPPKRKPPAPR